MVKPSLVIVGLGNPGKSYERTRHNAGFRAIDTLSEAFGQGRWALRGRLRSQVQEARVVTAPVLLAKPGTFMNLSGESLRKIVDSFTLDPKEQILVICDDIDLPLGEVRFRARGGPGTHNGLRSCVESIGEGFSRIRIGIGPGPRGEDLSVWVLSSFSKEEEKTLESVLQQLPSMVRSFVLDGAPAAKKN